MLLHVVFLMVYSTLNKIYVDNGLYIYTDLCVFVCEYLINKRKKCICIYVQVYIIKQV